MKKISIAIDGPSAAGKSTIAKIVAKTLNYVYIDTGAMYRCVAYYCINQEIDVHDEQSVCKALPDIDIRMDTKNNVYLNGKDVSNGIRSDQVSMAASTVSGYKLVREFLVKQQQVMASGGGVILDGRDIGTVVLKDAQLKIFLVASIETRARRRFLENTTRKIETTLEVVTKEIEQRDYQDTHRVHSPLKRAKDAIELDTSDLTLKEVVDKVIHLVKQVKEA